MTMDDMTTSKGLHGSITFTGKTDSDIRLAIATALERIQDGNTSGFDSNDSGSFSFTVDGSEVEEPACPDECPTCGVDLKSEGYPIGHQNDEGVACSFIWT